MPCQILGTLINQSTGRPAVGAQLVANLIPRTAAKTDDGAFIGTQVTAHSDVNGAVDLTVPRTDEITVLNGTAPEWRIICHEAGIDVTTTLTSNLYDLSGTASNTTIQTLTPGTFIQIDQGLIINFTNVFLTLTNLDPTNYIEIYSQPSPGNEVFIVTMQPGDPAQELAWSNLVLLVAKAHTGTCRMRVHTRTNT